MARRTPQPTLTPKQKAESDRIFTALQQAALDDLRALADLLATKDDSNTFGATEFAVRDIALRIGAKALESALEGRKKGGHGSSVACPHCSAPGVPREKWTAFSGGFGVRPLVLVRGNVPQ